MESEFFSPSDQRTGADPSPPTPRASSTDISERYTHMMWLIPDSKSMSEDKNGERVTITFFDDLSFANGLIHILESAVNPSPALFPRFREAYDCPDGKKAIVMDYVEGQPVRCTTEDEILAMLGHMIQTLRELAAHRVIHGNMHPSNIIRTDDGRYVLVAFDCAVQVTTEEWQGEQGHFPKRASDLEHLARQTVATLGRDLRCDVLKHVLARLCLGRPDSRATLDEIACILHYADLQFTVTDPRTILREGLHTQYLVTASDPHSGISVTVRRRYKEFLAFYGDLLALSNARNAPEPEDPLPPFPGKSFIFRFFAKQIERRRSAFETLLRAVQGRAACKETLLAFIGCSIFGQSRYIPNRDYHVSRSAMPHLDAVADRMKSVVGIGQSASLISFQH